MSNGEDDDNDDFALDEIRDSLSGLRTAWAETKATSNDDRSQVSEVSFDRGSSSAMDEDISALKHEIDAARRSVRAVRKPTSRFWQRLHVWSQRRQRKLDEMRSQRDADAELECTFRPAVLPRSLELVAKPSSPPSSIVRDRVELLRVELAERELRECTFQPQIDDRSRALAANMNRAALRPVADNAIEVEAPPTFQPKINARWRRLQRVREYCNVAAPERLSRPAPFAYRNRMENQQQQEQEELQKSKRLNRERILAFCQRQEASLHAKLQRIEAERRSRLAQRTMTPATKKAMEAFAMRQEEKCRRKLETIAELQSEMETSWRFRPTLDPRSDRLGESSKYRTRITPAKVQSQHKQNRKDHWRDIQQLRQRRTSPTTKLALKPRKVVTGNMGDFFERQRQFVENKNKRLAEIKDRYRNREDEILETIKMQEQLKKQMTPEERRLRAKEFAMRNSIVKSRAIEPESESDDGDQNVLQNGIRTEEEHIDKFRLDDPAR